MCTCCAACLRARRVRWWSKHELVPVAPAIGHALVGAHDDIHTLDISRDSLFKIQPLLQRATALFYTGFSF